MQKTDTLPGYTGYKPQFKSDSCDLENGYEGSQGKTSQIPGYQGYVNGIKSENVFGTTFGRTSGASADGAIPRGFDMSNQERYTSVSQVTFQNQQPLRGNVLKGFPFNEEDGKQPK